MNIYNLKGRFAERVQGNMEMINDANKHPLKKALLVQDYAKNYCPPTWSTNDVLGSLEDEVIGWECAAGSISDAKVILFSSEQAQVFQEASRNYVDSLDFKLPFSPLLIQFAEPIGTDVFDSGTGDYESIGLSGILLEQAENTLETRDEVKRTLREDKENLGPLLKTSKEVDRIGAVLNMSIAVYEDLSMLRVTWVSGSQHETIAHEVSTQKTHDLLLRQKSALKNLAIACIGYINCENIYLHMEGEVPERVNRKREAKGKSRLEPYYVCRIRGVNYESVATGDGTPHGFRYDVRGHFRKLSSGKTTWVKAHQRGLKNDLYIPKVYQVDQGSKPAWKGQPQ